MANNLIIIRNLAPWEVAFRRILTQGDVVIPPFGKLSIDKEEVVNQSYANNSLINGGFDDRGSHATIYIDDKDTRVALHFESEDGKEPQLILDDEWFAKVFELKQIGTFKKRLTEHVLTHAEKFRIIEYIKKTKINDYDKIRAVEEYVGAKVG